MDRMTLGRLGEDAAAAYLRKAGMRVLDRNWRTPRGEIDIVAAEGDCLVVCEVKTRRSMDFGHPLEAIGSRKMRTLRSLAGAWMTERSLHAPRVRIDAVGILVPHEGPVVVTHVRGAE